MTFPDTSRKQLLRLCGDSPPHRELGGPRRNRVLEADARFDRAAGHHLVDDGRVSTAFPGTIRASVSYNGTSEKILRRCDIARTIDIDRLGDWNAREVIATIE